MALRRLIHAQRGPAQLVGWQPTKFPFVPLGARSSWFVTRLLPLKARAFDVVGFERCAPMGETRSAACFSVFVDAVESIRFAMTQVRCGFAFGEGCR